VRDNTFTVIYSPVYFKKLLGGPNLSAKTTIYTIYCFKNVGVQGTPQIYIWLKKLVVKYKGISEYPYKGII
jgi:hypothetical protein